MSEIRLLLDVVSDMRSLADSLQAVCDAMAESEPADKDKKPAPVKEAELKKTAKSADKKIKLEDVRAVLAEKSQAGMTVKVREIIHKYGAAKLSEIEPKYYADILKDAEGLVNG
ncbi:rRNA biogenesis protein rrp5 [Clostridium tyrobutyricum]|uniref:rRNA biogenesis protein rrp5 n=1 Tax=Clostridium tyrobutyricum TaxID=1519 RepID=UPI001C3877CA|nr:rRNA biogenesis protein rrp5 [Clostridium tyrobutyricum]